VTFVLVVDLPGLVGDFADGEGRQLRLRSAQRREIGETARIRGRIVGNRETIEWLDTFASVELLRTAAGNADRSEQRARHPPIRAFRLHQSPSGKQPRPAVYRAANA